MNTTVKLFNKSKVIPCYKNKFVELEKPELLKKLALSYRSEYCDERGEYTVDISRDCQGVIKLLENVRESYSKHIGDKSLYLLKCYVDGFIQVVEFHNQMQYSRLFQISPAEEIPKYYDEFSVIREFFSNFQKWIEEKYSCTLSQSWCNIIRFHTDNEEDAFELFYAELDQFYKSVFFKNIIANQKNHNTNQGNQNANGYGDIYVLGDEIEFIKFKQEQYNNLFFWKLHKILRMIRKAPFLMIGEKSLSLVQVYINGFINAYNTIYADNVYEFFPGFEEWINDKLGLHMHRPWHKVILFVSTSEEEAFESFFGYLEEYLGT